jgi:hypothetical protein
MLTVSNTSPILNLAIIEHLYLTALKKPQISQMAQIFLSSNFASLRLCVSFFRQSHICNHSSLMKFGFLTVC